LLHFTSHLFGGRSRVKKLNTIFNVGFKLKYKTTVKYGFFVTFFVLSLFCLSFQVYISFVNYNISSSTLQNKEL
jgi:hypothetical protein